ncbi:MBL fold metallo-hydrolase [Sphingomonas parva]|uniref:MBL fold metallo-hydrolase n=1 Tax=Sphingomonas parva TaxID=2555898 RepID=A0A4Y8ZUC2_9SPHN|nr:MBL fold metallo-hydrolase [Sphingomonas parva]TFI58056.1 MBL fold metallo-hydrolase [Sphingomonas parva]
MTPSFHPRLVNDRFGDPGVFVEILHRREALLFDLGDLSPLSTRDLLRVSHVFVTHGHIDHFIGFDALLRVLVGRDRIVEVVGPRGFADRVGHKLLGYQWDLVDRYETDLVFEVTELEADLTTRRARFRFKRGFAREDLGAGEAPDGLVARGDGFCVRAAVLEHHGPSIGYAVEEPEHVNIWRNRLAERGLAPGPWLQALKQAVIDRRGDAFPVETPDGVASLGALREMLSVTPGQRVAYVTDVADTPGNREAIAQLAGGADLLFIESCFAAGDEAQAQARAHLTTRAAGEIARAAGVRRVEPFHFSPRYEQGGADAMIAEVAAAFESQTRAGSRSESGATAS